MSTLDNVVYCDQCNKPKPPLLCWNKKDFHLCFECLQVLASIYHIKEIPSPDSAPTNIRLIIKEPLRNIIYERDGYKCRYCGSKEHLVIDHIYPFSKGGKTEISNLQTLCKSCNSHKNNKTPEVANG